MKKTENLQKIQYISSVGKNGLTRSSSFYQIVDLHKIKPGDKVINMAGQECVLYNIFHDEFHLKKRGGISSNHTLGDFDKLIAKICQLVKLMKSLDSPILHDIPKGKEISHYQSILKFMNNYLEKPVKPRTSKWNLAKYQQLHNEIAFEITFLPEKYHNLSYFFQALSICFNGILFHHYILTETDGGLFPKMTTEPISNEDTTLLQNVSERKNISDFSLLNSINNVEEHVPFLSKKTYI